MSQSIPFDDDQKSVRQTTWTYYPTLVLKGLLVIVTLPVALFMMLLSLVIVVIILPFFMIHGHFENQRFWKRLRSKGLIKEWSDIANLLEANRGTLIVENYKQAYSLIYLDVEPHVVDPNHQCLSWWDAKHRPTNGPILDPVDEEAARQKRLADIEAEIKKKSELMQTLRPFPFVTACFTKDDIDNLSTSALQQRVFVTWMYYNGDDVYDLLLEAADMSNSRTKSAKSD